MWFAIIGLIFGIIFGILAPISLPIEWARYSAVGIVAVIDSLLGAARADVGKKYNTTIFVSGLVTNMFLAAVITYIGDRLGIDLYLAVIVAFTIRIIQNIGVIRRGLLTKFTQKSSMNHLVSKK